jgi:hypothetical protein
MNERVVPKMTNFCVVKRSNSPAITQHREVPVPRRQDVDERPCVPRLELNGPALRHFDSQPDLPRINQRFLTGYILAPGLWISLSAGAHLFFIASGFAPAVDKYIIMRCVLGAGAVCPGAVPDHPDKR